MMIVANGRVLADVQNETDGRGVALDSVGITGLHYPVTIRQRDGGNQHVTARIDLLVGLDAHQRGAHLSSLVEALQTHCERSFTLDDVVQLVRDIRARQDTRGRAALAALVRLRFKYFVTKTAPVSGATSLMAYDCGFEVTLGPLAAKSIVVGMPVSSVCPCSLMISDIGAHNQRANVTLQVWQPPDDARCLWPEDLVALVEESGSAPIHTLLKRADEKAVTEQMFRAPRFIEDIAREVVVRVRRRLGGVRYRVCCESEESIHAHNAYAEVSGVC